MLISLNRIFKFITTTCHLYKIDESHGIRHSMDILRITKNIFDEEKMKYNYLQDKEHIVYTSALLHDMCDDKYMKPNEGIDNIRVFLVKSKYPETDIDVILRIINTMSYSKVKKNGFPFIHEDDEVFRKLYHIVREADLLCAYEVERCIIYDQYARNNDFTISYKKAYDLFQVRMFKHFDDNLFTTSYALREGKKMHIEAKTRLKEIRKIIDDVDVDKHLL